MTASAQPPAGWYEDPEGTGRVRYWDGLSWSDLYQDQDRTEVVELECPRSCGVVTPVAAGGATMSCSGCHEAFGFKLCQSCGHTCPTAGAGAWKCTLCGNKNKSQVLSTAHAFDVDRRLLKDAAAAGDSKVLTNCTILGGSGFPVEAGTRCGLFVGAEKIVILTLGSGACEIPWSEIEDVQFIGNGAVKTGGGMWGGGFGITGAAIGILTATAINAATTRTSMDSCIQLRTREGELIIHSGTYDPESLRIICSALVTSVEKARAASLRSPGGQTETAIDRLAKVKALHEAGALTDGEYEDARAKLALEITSG
jgi:hypothetical protein